MSDSAVPHIPKPQTQRVRTITSVIHSSLRPDVAVPNPRIERHHATSATNTTTTLPSEFRDTDAGLSGNRPTGTKRTGGLSGHELLSTLLDGLNTGLMATLMAFMFWIMLQTLFPDDCHTLDDRLKRIFPETVIYQRKEADVDHELGGVWSRLVNILGYLTYCWDNDPAWYSGSILSKIMPIFRDVSLYTVAIVLAVYVIF